MLIYILPQDFPSVLQQVRAMKRPYTVKETSSSRVVKNSHIGFVSSEIHLGTAILGHLVSSKCEILKRAKDIDLSVPEGVEWCSVSEYFLTEQPVRSMYVNEFDLSHAYWKAAFKLGLISEVTYYKFLRFKTKKFRLIALGMLARKQLCVEYAADGTEIGRKIVTSEQGQRIFKRVAYEVACEMKRLAEENRAEFRWYWFDNCIMSNMVKEIHTDFEYRMTEQLMKYSINRSRFNFDLGGRKFVLPMGALNVPLFNVGFDNFVRDTQAF
jgi:hypothetical protein